MEGEVKDGAGAAAAAAAAAPAAAVPEPDPQLDPIYEAMSELDMQRHAASVVDRDDAIPSDNDEGDEGEDPVAAVDETDVCPHFSEDVR
jgi:hypothetical protein